MKDLKEIITTKLQLAESVCLITDSWSSKQQRHFIALGANLTYSTFEKETLVISMMATSGTQNAEKLKQCIEQMINEFDFNKSKIRGICYFCENHFTDS